MILNSAHYQHLTPSINNQNVFLQFASQEDIFLSQLEKENNIILDEILLFHFESIFFEYFTEIKEELKIDKIELTVFKDLSPNGTQTSLENLKIVNPKADKTILNELGLKDDEIKRNDWISVLKLSNKIIKEMLNLLAIEIHTEM